MDTTPVNPRLLRDLETRTIEDDQIFQTLDCVRIVYIPHEDRAPHCAICTESFDPEQVLLCHIPGCRNSACADCLLTYFRQDAATVSCPFCRATIRTLPAAHSNTTAAQQIPVPPIMAQDNRNFEELLTLVPSKLRDRRIKELRSLGQSAFIVSYIEEGYPNERLLYWPTPNLSQLIHCLEMADTGTADSIPTGIYVCNRGWLTNEHIDRLFSGSLQISLIDQSSVGAIFGVLDTARQISPTNEDIDNRREDFIANAICRASVCFEAGSLTLAADDAIDPLLHG